MGGDAVSLTDGDNVSEPPSTDDDAAATHADTGRAGVILAGGRSERFPTIDKALAPLDGTPLLRRVADALSPTVEELIINCRRDQQAAFAEVISSDPRFAIDPVADRGPLAGLRTALSATEATYAAILPCDMPFVPAGFIEYLFGQAQHQTGAVPCVGGDDSERYRRSCMFGQPPQPVNQFVGNATAILRRSLRRLIRLLSPNKR